MTTGGNCTYVQARRIPVDQEEREAGRSVANAICGKGLQFQVRTAYSNACVAIVSISVARRPRRVHPYITKRNDLHIVCCELRKRIRRGLLKARKPAAKHKFHAFRWSVTLLGNLELRLFPLFWSCSLLKKVRPVDEHDHVSVLLDGARLAQIGKLRPRI